MRKFYLFLSFVFSIGTFAQSQHFVFDPTDSYENTVSNIFWTDHGVFMENLTGGELILGWERLDYDFPDEWEADLCDYVSCYVGIPESGTMLPVSDTTRGFLKITLNPNGFVGTGTVSFRVYDDKHPDIADTLQFTIHTTVMSEISDAQNAIDFEIFPNPASDFLTIKSAKTSPASFKLLNTSGQIVRTKQVSPVTSVRLDLQELPKGVYIAVFSDEKSIIRRAKLIIQ